MEIVFLDVAILAIALAALAGALVTGLLGWVKSGEKWNARKFMESFLTGIGTAFVFALAYQITDGKIGVYDLMAAFIGGMGTDNLVNRAIGAIKKA